MSRPEQRFAELKAEGRAALVTFVTAGDPGYDASLRSSRACRPLAPT
jgi:tryptophan synthase alpha chain